MAQYTNYIFSGFGYSTGKFKISNDDIYNAIDKGFLQGFSTEKISCSNNYRQYREQNPHTSPFEYFAGYKMGFYERCHVTPFPPTAKKLYYAESSLDLAINAVKNALHDAEINANNIDAWFVSSVSQHQQAPGIAASIKSYFVDFDNKKPAFTLSSGCAGFNLNLERAINYFKIHPEAKHIVVAHTETMSSFLTNRIKFVPFVTFGDASAAVIISKINDNINYGIQNIVNKHDLLMLDNVGVDSNWNLYMNDSLIKDRATINIPLASKECLTKTNWNINDIDYFVPHQTGNVILFSCAEKMNVPINKVHIKAQNLYGNVSGSTVPLALSIMKTDNQLKTGTKILSATAGVGGNYGAFTYICHETKSKSNNFYLHNDELQDKKVLILGASGNIGSKLAVELEKRGAKQILHYNSQRKNIESIQNSKLIHCDFCNTNSIDSFISSIQNEGQIDYIVNAAGAICDNKSFDVNFHAPVKIINSILPQIKQS